MLSSASVAARFVAAAIGIVTWASPVQALAGATSYHFSGRSTGAYKKQIAGTVTMEGARCRIDFESNEQSVTELTSVLCMDDGSLVALNATNETWFRLKSRTRVAMTSALFSFRNAAISNLRVKLAASNSKDMRENATVEVQFSYDLQLTDGSEVIRGRVWGEIRVWAAGPAEERLAWSPVDIATGHPDVDEGLRAALAGISSPTRCEATISRTLANGAVMTESITRMTDTRIHESAVDPKLFAIPADYRYQEPVLGAPAGR